MTRKHRIVILLNDKELKEWEKVRDPHATQGSAARSVLMSKVHELAKSQAKGDRGR